MHGPLSRKNAVRERVGRNADGDRTIGVAPTMCLDREKRPWLTARQVPTHSHLRPSRPMPRAGQAAMRHKNLP
jgi:hypothetical protein